MYTIEIANSIKELKKEEWDAMIDDNVFISYGWLKTVEETFTEDLNPKYFLVQDHNKLIGAAVCYVFNKSYPVITTGDFLLGRLEKYALKLGISFTPTLICCPIYCYGKHFLIEKGTDTKKKEIITDKLLDAIENKASEEKLGLSFPNVMDNETDFILLLNRKGYNKTLFIPLNYLDIEWSSFEGYKNYVRRISKNMQKNIVKEVNKNRREGVIIKELTNIDRYEECLY